MFRRLTLLVVALMALAVPAYADQTPDPLPPGQITVPGQVITASCPVGQQVISSTASYYNKGKLKVTDTTPNDVVRSAFGEVIEVQYVTPKGVEYVSIVVVCRPATQTVTIDVEVVSPVEIPNPCPAGTMLESVSASAGLEAFIHPSGEVIIVQKSVPTPDPRMPVSGTVTVLCRAV
jgi:hypothetical protein